MKLKNYYHLSCWLLAALIWTSLSVSTIRLSLKDHIPNVLKLLETYVNFLGTGSHNKLLSTVKHISCVSPQLRAMETIETIRIALLVKNPSGKILLYISMNTFCISEIITCMPLRNYFSVPLFSDHVNNTVPERIITEKS